jgi:hypothetical protein
MIILGFFIFGAGLMVGGRVVLLVALESMEGRR